MKRLVLVRHAKAEQGGYDHDFSRNLADRGKNDAHRLGMKLASLSVFPDSILSSSAHRALGTARIFAEELHFRRESIIDRKELYFDYTTSDFIDMIRETSDTISTLFIFGHNPYIYDMAVNLSRDFRGDMPTCSTVVIDFDCNSWQLLEARQGQLVFHLYPSML